MMVNYSAALDVTFQALADPTRRAILASLAAHPDTTVSELARPFHISLPAVSRHLRVLESAGLLERRREGRVHHCRFAPGPMRTASEWIAHYERFWEGRLDALQRYLESSPTDENDKEGQTWKKFDRRTRRRRRRPSVSRAKSGPRATGSSGRGRTPSS